MPYASHPLGPLGETVRLNVRLLRKARGWSQVQLAQKIAEATGHAERRVILAIEAGSRRVHVDDLAALATAFGVTSARLLEPWECDTCHGAPPPRFTCRDCGAEGA